MSVFEKKVVKEGLKNELPLKKACPECGGNMFLKCYKEYFSLFGKNIIALQTLAKFYECSACGSAYSLSLKSIVDLDEKKKQYKFEEAKRLYAKALIASMTHMSGIDGNYANIEEQNLHGIFGKYPNIADELIDIMDFVKVNGNKDNYVFNLLKKLREELSIESVLKLLAEIVQMIMADGKMMEEEQILINAYIVASGLPKNMHKVLVEKMNN
ncbi:MAG: hypothetical protein B6I20_11885 [Bacteroidetes bacterium 4572_117]|nr:MAG: hypothetical protein B6I20_11885 [Bacteroidetes bacterium 4572_117]